MTSTTRGAAHGSGDRIVVRPSGPLRGRVRISGAKNSALKLMAACLLVPGDHVVRNVPDIVDVVIMADLLAAMGVRTRIDRHGEPGVVRITVPEHIVPVAPPEVFGRMRASTAVLGPLLARWGRATVSLPGGDDFGSRPIDLHVKGLRALGAEFEVDGGRLQAVVDDHLLGADIDLDFPSVGATENLVMAAVLAKGSTVIDNAAREPEIADLCAFLQAMGAHIDGVGTPVLTVHGVPAEDLRPVDHVTVPDRVEAATYLAAVGVAGGAVTLEDARAEHMAMLLRKLGDMGMAITPVAGGLLAECHSRLAAVDVCTLPYPGVATDYKPLITTMLSLAEGTSIVTENLFSGRFRYIEELQRLGADIRTDGHHAVVRGVGHLIGTDVVAHDIRAGAAMVVAGLVARGATVISGAHHLDRGYGDLVGKLRALGADIERLAD